MVVKKSLSPKHKIKEQDVLTIMRMTLLDLTIQLTKPAEPRNILKTYNAHFVKPVVHGSCFSRRVS